MPEELRDKLMRLAGNACEHPSMRECCDDCGHWHCPDCDLDFDDGIDFPQEID